MNKPLKFRYANEMAGAFALAALAAAVAAVFLAGRAKGWFEGRFEVRAAFDTADGSFGLEEGSDVLVRNTAAGRVDKIAPNANGQIEARFVLQERFHRFVTADATARVRMKFGVAGDAYVEILPGVGAPIAEGSYIACSKDEELMQTVQRVLAELQRATVPLIEEVRSTVHNASLLADGLQGGQGVAGRVLKDEEMARDARRAVTAAAGLMEEVRGTAREATRLIEGVQRHWLLRRYVTSAESEWWDTVPAATRLEPREAERLAAETAAALAEARTADDREAVARLAALLALCRMGWKGADAEARAYVQEAQVAARMCGRQAAFASVAEVEWLRRRGESAAAWEETQRARAQLPRKDKPLELYVRLLGAEILRDLGRDREADAELKAAGRLEDDVEAPALRARLADARGRSLSRAGAPERAAGEYDRAADGWRYARAFAGLADALEAAAAAYAAAGRSADSAERYFRSARTRMGMGLVPEARRALEEALRLAREAGDAELVGEVEALRAQAAEAGKEPVPAPMSGPRSDAG